MSARRSKVLLVDDEANIRFSVRRYLEGIGYEVTEAEDCAACLVRVGQDVFDIVLLDFKLPDGDALSVLPRLRELAPETPVLVLTGHATIDLAVRAMKEGAENFLAKPVELPAVQVVIERALENARNRKQRAAGQMREARTVNNPFLGTSRAIRELEDAAHRIAGTDRPVLLQGETGSGKGVLSAWLHGHGPRAGEPFVDLNCAGLSAELLESELFGHERGAFTGAVTTKVGLLEVAHRGTVFLDEIGEMDLQVQPKLLKVIEEQRLRRLGDVKSRAVDFRLIAASHRDLAALSQHEKFRSDLYFRLSTLPLRIPALRERVEDIPVLANQMLSQLSKELARGEITLAPESVKALQARAWPGNIRELRNVLERAVLLNAAARITPQHLQFDASPAAAGAISSATATLLEVERSHIERVLASTHGRVDAAANVLGLPLSSLYQKLKRYGIQRPARQ